MVEPQPTKKPEWNTGGANRTEPAAGEKTSGWAVDDEPPSSYFNWLQYYTYAWLEWLNERFYKGSLEVDLIIKALQPDTSGNGGRLVLDGGNANTSGAGGYVHMTAGDGLGSTGGDIRVRAGSSNTGNGGPVDIDAGFSTSGAGGDVTIDGGAGATGGGDVDINGGDATAGAGGDISVTAGDSVGSEGGDINIAAGPSDTGGGGDVEIGGGDATTSGVGGDIELTGGTGIGSEGGNINILGGPADVNGGDIFVAAGSCTASGPGGFAKIKGGTAVVGDGGDATLEGGSSSSGAGGDVFIDGGEGVNAEGGDVAIIAGPSNSNGGDIVVTGGENTGTGGGGDVDVSGGDSTTGTAGSAYLNGGDVQILGAGGLARVRGGNASGLDQSAGNVTISTGYSTGTDRGFIQMLVAESESGGVGAGTYTNIPAAYVTMSGQTGNKSIVVDRFTQINNSVDSVRGVMRLVPKAKPTTPSAGDIYPDSSADQLRYYDGSRYHGLSPNVYGLQAYSLTVDDATAAEKAFQLTGPVDLKYTIPGGYLDVGAVIRVRAQFVRAGTLAGEPGFRIRLGSYSGLTGAVVAQVSSNASGATLYEFELDTEFAVTLATASGSIIAATRGAATPSATTWWTDFTCLHQTTAGSIDFTGSLELYPTVVWNAVGTGLQTMQCRQFSVDII